MWCYGRVRDECCSSWLNIAPFCLSYFPLCFYEDQLLRTHLWLWYWGFIRRNSRDLQAALLPSGRQLQRLHDPYWHRLRQRWPPRNRTTITAWQISRVLQWLAAGAKLLGPLDSPEPASKIYQIAATSCALKRQIAKMKNIVITTHIIGPAQARWSLFPNWKLHHCVPCHYYFFLLWSIALGLGFRKSA